MSVTLYDENYGVIRKLTYVVSVMKSPVGLEVLAFDKNAKLCSISISKDECERFCVDYD